MQADTDHSYTCTTDLHCHLERYYGMKLHLATKIALKFLQSDQVTMLSSTTTVHMHVIKISLSTC